MIPLLLAVSFLAAPEDEKKAAQEFFERLHEAYQAGGLIDEFVDFDAIFVKVASHGVEVEAVKAYVRGLRATLSANLPYLATERVRVRRIKLHDTWAIVDVDHASRDELHRVRWFVQRGEDGFKVYDATPVDEGVSFLRALSTVARIQARGPRAVAAMRTVSRARQLLQDDEYERVARLLETLKVEDLPGPVRATRAYWLMLAYQVLDENENALKVFQDAERQEVTSPLLTWTAATVCGLLEQHDDVVRHAKRYLELVGPHALAYQTLGDALMELDRPVEAAAAYRAGLADDPQFGMNVAGLAVALPKDKKGEFLPHFKRLSEPRAWMEDIGDHLFGEEDYQSLELLVGAFGKIAPGHRDHVYYSAQLRIHAQEFKEAAAMLAAAIPKVEDDDEREAFVEQYADSMMKLQRSLEALRTLPVRDRRHGFTHMAGEFTNEGKFDRLAALIDAHVKADADNRRHTLVWQVELFYFRASYAEAARLVAAKLATIRAENEDDAWRAEESWVRSLIRLKRSADAVAAAAQCPDTDLQVIAHAANGDVEKTIAAFSKAVEDDWEPATFYDDDDIGKLLREGEAFAPLREKYPPK